MKIFHSALLVFALTFALVGCSTDSAEEASATSGQPPASGSAAARVAPVSTPKLVQVPAGTPVSVLLVDAISTKSNNAGDQFLATLAEPIVINGSTVAEKGAKVQGRVVDAEGAGRVKGRANIRMVLTSITADGKSYPIVTKPFVAQAQATKGRDAAVIGGAAGVGATIGAIAGGKKGAGTGAVIGGAAGTGTVLATKGKEVEFGPETRLKFTLDKAAELPMIRGRIS